MIYFSSGNLISDVVHGCHLKYICEVKILSYCAKFSALIRKHRKNKHYSLETLAELCNVSDRSIGNIERGVSNPRLNTVVKLCRKCGIYIGLLSYLNVGESSHDDDSMLLSADLIIFFPLNNSCRRLFDCSRQRHKRKEKCHLFSCLEYGYSKRKKTRKCLNTNRLRA